jgi:hypothetical protein
MFRNILWIARVLLPFTFISGQVSHYDEKEYWKIKKFWKGSWSLSIINVYGRDNAYSVFLRNDSRILNRSRVYTLRKLYLIGVPLPTLTYNFSF